MDGRTGPVRVGGLPVPGPGGLMLPIPPVALNGPGSSGASEGRTGRRGAESRLDLPEDRHPHVTIDATTVKAAMTDASAAAC
jgi:hypothetical protein